MTVAVFVTSESDANCLISWGVRIACAEHSELLVICPRKSKGKRAWKSLEVSSQGDNVLFGAVFDVLQNLDPEKVVLKQDIKAGIESSDLDRTAIETRELISPNPEDAFVEELGGLDVQTLVLPAHVPIKGASENEMAWAQKLFKIAPCQVVMVRGNPPSFNSPLRILVASHDETSSDDLYAVSHASRLAKATEKSQVTVLYVRPDDDVVARQVAEKHLRQLERGRIEKTITLGNRIELADSFTEGINRLPLDEFDLVLVGTRNAKTIGMILREVGQSEEGGSIAVSVARVAVPLTDRVWGRFRSLVRSKVPQLDREHRVSLVDRLQDNSKFDFDFVALISLSTLIAALGLARDSGAVVIGAMLVAPLMTPLVGMGFALVQGNTKLIRSALKSVAFGFTVALLIGAFVGLLLHVFAPHLEISLQMRQRDAPNMLDFVVALASGVAGAYAMGRPNLVSALPGVAIAAALVPPIATSGLALMMGDFLLAGNALLLFFTNIIAIVLGTTMTFWAVGISTRVSADGRSPQVWPRYWFYGFVIISFLLALFMSYVNPVDPAEASSERDARRGNIQALVDL
ncbi:MAG: DUF389 domain-containing protein [Mariniblastus sp.]|nr:DUF389 domain-containing protein [Mariniblastus sp.]